MPACSSPVERQANTGAAQGLSRQRKEEDFKFDDGEVSEVRWIPYAGMEEFRERFAKKPLRKDKITFKCLKRWFEQNGYLQTK